MAETRAFATSAEGHFASIRLNRRGREPLGAVASDEVDALLTAIESRLAGQQFGSPARPLLVRSWRGKELYPGPFSEFVVPDLIVELDPDVRVVNGQAGPVFDPEPRPFPDHDRWGVFVAAGPGVGKGVGGLELSILDVTPTVLTLLDLPVYDEMSGRVAAEILVDPAAHRAPRTIRESDDHGVLDGTRPARPLSAAEVEQLEERLRSLGYLD